MKQAIENLIYYEIEQQTIRQRDYMYVKNQLYYLIGLEPSYEIMTPQQINHPSDALNQILDTLEKSGRLDGSVQARDWFDAKLMNVFALLPSMLEYQFNHLSSDHKMGWLYHYAQALNYIRMDRILKNQSYTYQSPFGHLEITINMSKPEKDPKSIANALTVKHNVYPKCLLCKENEGFSGNPSRDQHRLIKFDLAGESWYFQYSPYIYYNEHAIVLSDEHRLMHVDQTTFRNLLLLTDIFPGYFFGSNADLPIVGGSILTHDHYQGGKHHFPIEKASVIKSYTYHDLTVEMIHWPLSTIRIRGHHPEKIVQLADRFLKQWLTYNHDALNIKAYTHDERHHTMTSIARKRDEIYELDLVLRDNHTSKEHPLGIFHPHADKWHIKKENIGLIEAMGLAILPKRLMSELTEIKAYITDHKPLNKASMIHQNWIDEIKDTIDINHIDQAINEAVGQVFEQVLIDCGVFKLNNEGKDAFDTFIKAVLS